MCTDTLHAHKAKNLTVTTFTIPVYIIMNKLSCFQIHLISKLMILYATFHTNQGSNIIRKIQKNFTDSELCFLYLHHEVASMF